MGEVPQSWNQTDMTAWPTMVTKSHPMGWCTAIYEELSNQSPSQAIVYSESCVPELGSSIPERLIYHRGTFPNSHCWPIRKEIFYKPGFAISICDRETLSLIASLQCKLLQIWRSKEKRKRLIGDDWLTLRYPFTAYNGDISFAAPAYKASPPHHLIH